MHHLRRLRRGRRPAHDGTGMDETLTRLAFRVQGGDRDAARTLLVEARARQNATVFDRAAKALEGSAAILEVLEESVTAEERTRTRALFVKPAEAAKAWHATPPDLAKLRAIGPNAMVVATRWMLDSIAAWSPYAGSGQPYYGSGFGVPWTMTSELFGSRVETPWLGMRVLVALDARPWKRQLADAVVKAYFGLGPRTALAAQTVLAHESPPSRRIVWGGVLEHHPERVDDATLSSLLDDPHLRERAFAILVERGRAVARHALPFLNASAPGTRRIVASLLARVGDRDAVPFLRQALSRERDPRARVQISGALEKISGAEPLVPKATGEDVVVARARAALATPRQPKPPMWLATLSRTLPALRWSGGHAVTPEEIDAIVGRLALLRDDKPDAAIAEVRAALEASSARAIVAAIRASFTQSRERGDVPEWIVRAMALLLPEHDLDLACEEMDASLRASAHERWKRRPEASAELVWDPDIVATSPCRAAFAWLTHWADTGPKRPHRTRADRALSAVARAIPEDERPFASVRRFGLDEAGERRFGYGDESLIVRVRTGGAIEVLGSDGARLTRLPTNDRGKRVREHVAAVEEALLDARRTLAEAYAERLVVDVRFVRGFLLAHPVWRPIVHGCVVRRAFHQILRVSEKALAAWPDEDSLQFVLAQVEG